jgi:hypothetical protein
MTRTVIFLVFCTTAFAGRPVLLEAEAHLSHAVVEVADDACSGAAFARSELGKYQPLLRAEIPTELGEGQHTLWLRRRGGPVQVKRTVEEKQIPARWHYVEEVEFVWEKVGTWSREQWGTEIVIITGAKSSPAAEVDALVWSAEPEPDLDALLPALPVAALSVQWDQGVRLIPAEIMGLNGFAAYNPAVTEQPGYLENLAHMRPGYLRVHHAELMADSKKSKGAGWMNHQDRKWDAERVLSALRPLREAGHQLIPCIPHWPDWMDADDDGYLDANQFLPFAKLCAELVRIVNQEGSNLPSILDWEITNELDERYHQRFYEAGKPDRLPELVRLYQLIAREMKRMDQRIRTGGPSAMNSYNFDFHQRFISACASEIDFYTVHLYVSGKSTEPDSLIWKRADSPAYPIARIRDLLDAASGGIRIPLHLNEYNIGYDWRKADQRMVTGFGAVWDAWFMFAALEAGADAAAAWNECDGVYGKTTAKHQRRPAAELWHLLTRHVTGLQRQAVWQQPSSDLKAVASTSADAKSRSLLVINRGARARTVVLNTTMKATRHDMDRTGLTSTSHQGDTVHVPAGSLALFVW